MVYRLYPPMAASGRHFADGLRCAMDRSIYENASR
jgi:hypothetical protein